MEGENEMEQLVLKVRMDAERKRQLDELCADVGLDASTAINLFVAAFIREQRLPFEVKAMTPNEVTRAALNEGDRMLRDPNAKRFSSVDELFEDLET